MRTVIEPSRSTRGTSQAPVSNGSAGSRNSRTDSMARQFADGQPHGYGQVFEDDEGGDFED